MLFVYNKIIYLLLINSPDLECPEGKVYQACGLADPPTCKDKYAFISH